MAVTDIGAYTALSTDNLPRYLARLIDDTIWLDNGTQVGILSGAGASPGATLIPIRPSQSPQPWLYIANGSDYQKFSSPVSNVVTQRKVGIAEPQSPPDACPDQMNVSEFTSNAASWTATGTAGALSDITRTTDTCVALFADPASISPSLSTRYSMQVGTGVQYQAGMEINVVNTGAGGTPVPMIVQDVFPPAAANSSISIQAIQYFSGSNGRCVIVPSQMPIDNSVPEFQGLSPTGDTLVSQAQLGSLRRGSLIQLGTGGNLEVVFVLNVTHGPQGLIAFECVTSNTHVAAETMIGKPAIAVSFTQAPGGLVGQVISAAAIQSSVTSGVGLISKTIAAANNPFTHQPFVSDPTLPTAQADDYVHLSALVSDLTLLTGIRILFDVGDGSFTQNYFYYDVQPSALVSAVAGTQTQLGATSLAAQQTITRDVIDQGTVPTINPTGSQLPGSETLSQLGINLSTSGTTDLGASQWNEILFPIASFTRVGNDESKTLANCNAARIQVTVTGSVTFDFGSIWVESGGQPDVGDNGALYFYQVRPRDSRTGVVGNPSPATRYGVGPRRQRVIVPLPSAAYDSQIDTWDVFRYGGTITSFRYIGSAIASASAFVDNVFDSEAQVGSPLDQDNFEPWPTIDLPQALTATSVNGTVALVTIPAPTNALRWLPGTLVQLAGGQVFTLRLRPVLISGTTYRLEFIECAAPGTNVTATIQEPILGNQKLPYMWGPDANGTVFGCGDPLRPGVLYFSKAFAPDQCPDANVIEITAPSEPLAGGEIVDGLSVVASPERQWALYPQPDNPTQPYNQVLQPVVRGFAAPWGHCSDGQQIRFWAKDGIWGTTDGSYTDADLYPLFPHDGVPGVAITYAGVTYPPPDYKRVAKFRLAYVNGFMYATYQDTTGTYHTLVVDKRNAWSVDDYSPAVSVVFHPPQPASTLQSSSTLYDEMVMGNVSGQISAQAVNTNDLGGPIACALAPFEFDGGDIRAPAQWGDYFLDLTPAAVAGVIATPVSQGIQVASPSTVASSASRQRVPLSVGGVVVSDFLGLVLRWTDNFSTQTAPTEIHAWQPSWDLQPAYIVAFQTFGTAFGLKGFMHIPQLSIAYVATQAVTFTIGVVDGTAPASITLPSTGGVYSKILLRPTFNKGQLYTFAATSAARFQLFLDDCEVMVALWGRQGPAQLFHGLGERNVEAGAV